jgi:hypothetical protein
MVMAKQPKPGHVVRPATDMVPDQNNLLTVHQVAGLACRRACRAIYKNDFALYILGPKMQTDRKRTQGVVVTATDFGRWSLIGVLAACCEAVGQPTYRIRAGARIRNPGGLDELKIARIIAADGVRPYLARPSRKRNGVVRPVDPRLRAQAVGVPEDMDRATAGERTWLMLKLMAIPHHSQIAAKTTYNFRRCIGLLNEVGLLETQPGEKGGIGTATHTWMPSAYLPTPPERAPEIDQGDEWALRGIAL